MNLNGTPKKLRPKAQSRNPSGRPRTLPISDALREILEQSVPAGIRKILRRELRTDLKPDACFADAIALVLVAKAVTGDVSAIKEIMDRVEGRAGKSDEFGARPEVKFRVVYDSPIAEAVRPAEPIERSERDN